MGLVKTSTPLAAPMQWHGQNKLGALVMSVVLVQAEGEQSSQYFGYRHTTLVLEPVDQPVYRWLVDC
jgi:hypothetical protein